MTEIFTGSFTQQEPIPEAGIAAALRVLQSGRLHRYNVAEGETAETALLEEDFAAITGARFCVALSSGGYALACAMRAAGVTAGARVLTNAFTLAPVPGAIAAVGAVPVFVGVTEALVIDLDDLERKAASADWLMLSHMRGHLCDMDRLMAICARHGVTVIEDCAHTMGGSWRGTPSGRFGVAGCFSTQTYKHANSGEGGFLITDDEMLAARAILLSGSYMLYDRHRAAPAPEVFERVKYLTPNMSGRMDNLRAAILRPQLADLDRQVARWNARYAVVDAGLRDTPGLTRIARPAEEVFVGSSIQFLLLDWSDEAIRAVLARCAARGVELKWFGAPEPAGFTSRYDSWRYAPSERMPASDRILRAVVDMRLPLTFSEEDCATIARIIRQEVAGVSEQAA
ncbi:DegT/DnrJ/EryC1/StrS aminotransferase family protein [Cognatishimia sp. F0-27]|uniref:DegT/DnrJ/EryC1/StrS family aminotransferase n=1 Tax=Cognatishimia sp. F0-27 TaxID=2816855 RepID=UPI001D0C9C98|nr:DegT/DnrJ/EryC1/StrS family aminotransferase [Cognatishimia sp. F0-27]MCC1494386.1 DegT/DnrJ/EryC1/StrS family aminotransferase [Cognatishimia sp. F0-27]